LNMAFSDRDQPAKQECKNAQETTRFLGLINGVVGVEKYK